MCFLVSSLLGPCLCWNAIAFQISHVFTCVLLLELFLVLAFIGTLMHFSYLNKLETIGKGGESLSAYMGISVNMGKI